MLPFNLSCVCFVFLDGVGVCWFLAFLFCRDLLCGSLGDFAGLIWFELFVCCFLVWMVARGG